MVAKDWEKKKEEKFNRGQAHSRLLGAKMKKKVDFCRIYTWILLRNSSIPGENPDDDKARDTASWVGLGEGRGRYAFPSPLYVYLCMFIFMFICC